MSDFPHSLEPGVPTVVRGFSRMGPKAMQAELDFLTSDALPWRRDADNRSECFMAGESGLLYDYGTGKGHREYRSEVFHPWVREQVMLFRSHLSRLHPEVEFGLNACFLNMYRDERDHLGWHADDHPGMDQSAPVVVLSYGATRQFWWRRKRDGSLSGEDVEAVILEHGDVLIMPPGFQATHEHRLPKSDRKCGPRVSLTLRRFAAFDEAWVRPFSQS